MFMKIIMKNQEIVNIINKSKFIGIVMKVYTKDDIDNILNKLKKEYTDATHICYAYILNNEKKYSDDNEPTGTAGRPILDVLEKNDLNYILAIVIRYFGGIKLGSNGLVRAYSNTISQIIKDNIKEMELGYIIEIKEDYHKSNDLDYLLKDNEIIEKEFTDKLRIKTIVKKDQLTKLNNINYSILEEVII